MRLSMIVSTLLLAVFALPAQANWKARNDGQGFIAAEACVARSSRQCVRLQCLAVQGGGIHWYIDAPGPGYSPESTNVTWEIDGRNFTVAMTKAGPADNRIQSYEGKFDPAAHQGLIERLKTGKSLTIGSSQFRAFTVPLRGSGAALSEILSACPFTASIKDISSNVPAKQIAEPLDAVRDFASGQSCVANEDEIFQAITNAGFGVWDANQFVVRGTKNGTLQFIGKANGVHSYRVIGCQAGLKTRVPVDFSSTNASPNVLTVNPNATELNIASRHIPQPVRQRRVEIAAACGADFQTKNRDEKAFLADDVNADGVYDFLLDHNLFCPARTKTFCDASGCLLSLFVSNNGDWQMYEIVAHGYKEFTTNGLLLTCINDRKKAGVFMENGRLVQRNCQR